MLQAGEIVGTKAAPQNGISAEAQELLAKASPEDLKVANQRYQIIKPVLAGNLPGESSTPQRTIYDWIRKYRQAQRLHRCGFVGLLPQWHRCGNRTQKLPEESRRLINQFISDNYETLKQKFKYEVYGELVLACEQQGVQPPSYKTFVKAINSRAGAEQTKKRAGRRRAYEQTMFYWELTSTTPRHGERP